MVQLTITHPTSFTSSNLHENILMISTEVSFILLWISPWHTRRFVVPSLTDLSLTSTSPYLTPAWASNIYNLSIPNLCHQAPFSLNHGLVLFRSQLTRHKRYVLNMVLECHHNIWKQPVSTAIPYPSSLRNITTTRKHQHFVKILKYIFSYVFQDSFTYSWYTARILPAPVLLVPTRTNFHVLLRLASLFSSPQGFSHS